MTKGAWRKRGCGGENFGMGLQSGEKNGILKGNEISRHMDWQKAVGIQKFEEQRSDRMLKRWEIGTPDSDAAAMLAKQGGVTKLCAEVLVSRGMQSLESASAFLDETELSDPFLMADMEAAAERILAAVDNGESICVYGDYDCDGVTATVMLTDWLSCAGADVRWYIPTRKEGYGMREEQIRKLAEDGVQLIITVDTGISAIEEAKYIRELGMDLVITDHHRPGDEIPEAVAVVDPYRADCPSPYKSLCGAGVVLKLIAALEGGVWESALEQFGDLAALGTIADVVMLDGENRFIVKRGLELLANTERMGLLSLMAVCGIEEGTPITATAAAFQLIPRINAAGRFASAAIAAKLFLTDDPDEAQLLAAEIHSLNDRRRETEQEILQEILHTIQTKPDLICQRVLVFAGENWHHGVIGIVAARLMDRFGKPCFLMAKDEDGYRGSARSFGAFSVFECLKSCGELLVRYGGHPGAGGFTVAEENLQAFMDGIQSFAAKEHPEMPVMTVHAERALSPKDLTVRNVDGLKILEPYGAGNTRPLFVLIGVTVTELYPLSGGQHTKLRLRKDGAAFDALLFRMAPEETGIMTGMTLDFLVSMEVRSYQGKAQLTVRVEDWRSSCDMQEQAIAAQFAYDAYRRGEQLPKAYYKRMCPHREDLVAVYQSVMHVPVSIAWLCDRLRNQGMNRCRARMCADIFSELGLLEYDAATDRLKRIPVREKKDLGMSARYRAILELAK